MSGMMQRQPTQKRRPSSLTADEADSNVDVEGQSPKNMEPFPSRSPWRKMFASRTGQRSPLSEMATDILRPRGTGPASVAIALMKVAAIGLLLAFGVAWFVSFLLLQLPTARNVRRAAALVNDPEALIDLEEGSGLKFMGAVEHDAAVAEIRAAEDEVRRAGEVLSARAAEMTRMRAETDRRAEERWRLEALLGLDEFCGECVWSASGRITCAGRVEKLRTEYQIPRPAGTFSAMERESCRRDPVQEMKLALFCPGCAWATNSTCRERVEYLIDKGGITEREGKLQALEVESCKMFPVDSKVMKLARYCPKCDWGGGIKCEKRVKHLMDNYKITWEQAKLQALERPSCSGVRKEGPRTHRSTATESHIKFLAAREASSFARESPPRAKRRGPGGGGTVVVYSGPTSVDRDEGKNDIYLRNFEYFLAHGIDCSRDDVVLVLTHPVAERYARAIGAVRGDCPGSRRPPRVVERKDRCLDMESVRVVLEGVDLSAYDNLVYVNCGMAGPRLPSADVRWTDEYTSLLSDEIKMSGISIASHHHPHVQSFLFAVDRVGLDIIRKSGVIYDCGKDNAGIEPDETVEIIQNYEVGMGRAMFEAGYGIASTLGHGGGPVRLYPEDVDLDLLWCVDLWYEELVHLLGVGGKYPSWEDLVFFKSTRGFVLREVQEEMGYDSPGKITAGMER